MPDETTMTQEQIAALASQLRAVSGDGPSGDIFAFKESCGRASRALVALAALLPEGQDLTL